MVGGVHERLMECGGSGVRSCPDVLPYKIVGSEKLPNVRMSEAGLGHRLRPSRTTLREPPVPLEGSDVMGCSRFPEKRPELATVPNGSW